MNQQQRAVVQQALEAFEYIDNNYMSLPKAGSEAVTDLRQLLEQPEQVCPHGTDSACKECHEAAQPAPVQEPVIDHSCKDTYELIMKWADIYAAQTGELYSQAAQDPSKTARMAGERTMLACVVAQAFPPQPHPAPDLLNALKRIVDEPNNTMSDGKALKEIIRIARAAINKATGEKT